MKFFNLTHLLRFALICSLTVLSACSSSTQDEVSKLIGAQEVNYVPVPITQPTATPSALSTMSLVSGDGQTVPINSQALSPLMVLIKDSSNLPISNASVVFQVGSGGTLSSYLVNTNTNGLASVNFIAGATLGPVSVTATSSSGSVTFNLTVTNMNSYSIQKISGDLQTNHVGSTLSGTPVKVLVLNSSGAPAPNVPMSFAVISNNGHFGGVSNLITTTDANGYAQGTFTLGTTAGANVVKVSIVSAPGVFSTFSNTGTVPANSAVSLSESSISLSQSTALANGTQQIGVTVLIKDTYGNLIPNANQNLTVTFSPAVGTWVSGAALNYSGVGTYTNTYKVGTTATTVVFTAFVGVASLSSGTASLTLNSGSINGNQGASLIVISGSNQTVQFGQQAAAPLKVMALDSLGIPISGSTITFTVNTSGGGTLSGGSNSAIVNTGVDGTAQVNFIAGNITGPVSVSAGSMQGSTAFAMTVQDLTGYSIEKTNPLATDNQSGYINSALSNPLKVRVLNLYNAPVAGMLVRFKCQSANCGTFSNFIDTIDVTTDANGYADATYTVGNTVGTYVIRAFIPSQASLYQDFTASGLANPASAVSLAQSTVSLSNSTISANGLSTVTITLSLKDSYGNAVPDGTKTVSVTPSVGGLGTLLGGGFSYIGNGQYSRSYQVGSTVGVESFTGTIAGIGQLTSAPAQLNLISNAYNLSFSTLTKSVNSLVANGTNTAVITFTLRDSYGNTVVQPGHTVKFNLINVVSGTLLNSVVDDGNGNYSQVFRVSNSSQAGGATFTVDFKPSGSSTWITNVGTPSSVTITINPGAVSVANSTFIATKMALPPNGTATSALIVSVKDSNGNLVPGNHTVTITKQSGTGTLSVVTNNGDGTYTATLTAPAANGSGIFAASLNGNAFPTKTVVYANLAGTTIDCTNYISGGYNNMDVYVEAGTLTINTRVNDSLGCNLNFNSLTIGSGGVITHSAGTVSNSYGTDFTVTGNLTILPGGSINTNSKGYYAGYGGSIVGVGYTIGNTATGGAQYSSCVGAGASHGGSGGNVASLHPLTTGSITNAIYGDASDPIYPGSGGGTGYTGGCSIVGGFGGGVIRISAANIINDGTISANGGNGTVSGSYAGGGGSGGSIKLTLTNAGKLTGSGTITANGGTGGLPAMNSGGGGRIAIQGDDSAWPLSRLQVNSGNTTGFSFSNMTGGTIWRSNGAYSTAQTLLSDLFIDDSATTTNIFDSTTPLALCNGSTARGITLKSGTLNLKSLSVGSNCWVTSAYTIPGVNPFPKVSLNITDTLNVNSGGMVTTDNKGYPAIFSTSGRGYTDGNSNSNGAGYATGNATVWPNNSAGGSYGGRGGVSIPLFTHPSWMNSSANGYPSGPLVSNATYGLASNPILPGSAGGTYNTSNIGSNGGGYIAISAGNIVNDGTISANGSNLVIGGGGAGSGGGIKLTINSGGMLTGAGAITANGGTNSVVPHSAGGGGRIAIVGDDSNWPLSQLQVNSGAPGVQGLHSGGTIYRSLGAYVGTQTLNTDILVDQSNDTTNIFGSGLNLTIGASKVAVFDVPISLASLTLSANSILTNSFPEPGVNPIPFIDLNISGTLTINLNSKISSDYRGYPHGRGLGAGYTIGNTQTGGSSGGGGAYGGTANRTGFTTTSNATYGSVSDPQYPGSGSSGFGSGGGLIRIKAASVVNHGQISANGGGYIFNNWWGIAATAAGSGGGIKVEMTSGTLTGSGTISANGGSGGSVTTYLGTEGGAISYSGAGGGGRIAIIGDDTSWPLSQLSVNGTVPLISTSMRTHLFNPGTIYRSLGAYVGNQTLNTDLWIENKSTNLTTNIIGTDTNLILPLGKTLVLDKPISLTNLTMESGSMITSYQSINTVNRTEISASGTITIQPAAKIDVTGRGYLGAYHPLNGTAYGLGFGFLPATPVANNSTWYTAGNHLSFGYANSASQTWDSIANPNFPGGGGATYNDGSATRIGTAGGGVIRLFASTLNVGGSILAEGQNNANSQASGCGAGGSILLNATTLNYTDTPMVSAKGGTCGNQGGGGAGGLIKVIRQTETGTHTPVVTGGTGPNGNGAAGTVAVGTN